MMRLPYFQSAIRELQMLQNQWSAILNPVLSNPSTNPSFLKQVSLVSGDNVINHKLDQVQQGWYLTDINAAVSIYRSQPFNDKTLTLNSSGAAIVNIAVF